MMAVARRIPEHKIRKVQELTQLLKEYDTILIADLHKVRAQQLQELRKRFRGKVLFKVVKNTLLRRAIDACKEKKNLEKLKDYLKGSNILLLTRMNPFKLAIELDKTKIKMPARPGDVATSDIVIPAGNTGLPPGPIMSELAAVGIRTRVESGSVWVIKDTVVAKKGDVISEKLAAVLTKLGIKPIEVGLRLKVAYDSGIIIEGDQLLPDVKAEEERIKEAASNAYLLALGIAYEIPEILSRSISIAHRSALSLALAIAYPSPETIKQLLALAASHAEALKRQLPS